MKTVTKVFIIIAIVLVVVGSMIFSIAGAVIDFDFNQIDSSDATYELVTHDYSVTEFEKMDIDFRNVPLIFAKSADDKIHVKFYDSNKWDNNFKMTKNTLEINRRQVSWFNFSFNFSKNGDVIVELPTNYDVQMNVEVSNGLIDLNGFNFTKEVYMYVNNGIISVENSNFSADVELNSSNGGLNVDNSIFKGKTFLEESNGQIKLENSDFNVVSAEVSNGRIYLDDVLFNEAKLTSSNGKVSGTIVGKKSEFTISTTTSNGSSNIEDQSGTGAKRLTVKTNNGSIDIDFTID